MATPHRISLSACTRMSPTMSIAPRPVASRHFSLAMRSRRPRRRRARSEVVAYALADERFGTVSSRGGTKRARIDVSTASVARVPWSGRRDAGLGASVASKRPWVRVPSPPPGTTQESQVSGPFGGLSSLQDDRRGFGVVQRSVGCRPAPVAAARMALMMSAVRSPFRR